MKVICDRAALLDAINIVSGAAAVRTPRAQLTCVKLSATKKGSAGELTLLATDGELAIRLTLAQVEVQKPGEALIPADKLRQIISAEDTEPTLTLETDGEQLSIQGQDAFFKIFGYPPADFPPVPEFADVVKGSSGAPRAETVFTHLSGALAALVNRTIFATARENSRYAINGVLMKRDGKRLEMVATDGRRLALCRSSLPAADKDAKALSCIIPTKALGMIQKLIVDGEEHVQIAITDNQIFFNFTGHSEKQPDGPGRAMLASNLVEGTFPPYEDVIPRDQDKRATFDKAVLASAVRRAGLLTNEDSRGVRMRFTAKTKQLELSSRAPEVGEAKVDVPVSAYDGEDIEIGFNPQFIADALKVIPENEVVIELKAPNKPGLVKSGTDFVYVVMPVNLT